MITSNYDRVCDECIKGKNPRLLTVHSLWDYPCAICRKPTKNMLPLGEAKRITILIAMTKYWPPMTQEMIDDCIISSGWIEEAMK